MPWATTHGFRYVELRYLTEGGARIHKRSRPHFVIEESEKGNGDCAKNTSGQAPLRMTDRTLFGRAGTPPTLDTLEAFRCENAPFVFHFVCAKRLFAKTDFDRFGTYKMTHV